MAVEAKRGCGYRKVGGLYLVCNSGGVACCRLPIPLTVCPCCGEGIKQARGWVWVNPTKLLPPAKCTGMNEEAAAAFAAAMGQVNGPLAPATHCPGANPAHFGERAGMLWIGKAFYPTAQHFHHEANTMGVSRRIKALPQGFKLGEQWVLLAHPEACTADVDGEQRKVGGVFLIFKPQRVEKIVLQSEVDCAEHGVGGDADELRAERERDAKRGITWVPVPDGDKDHQGTVYDDNEPEGAK